MKRNLIIMLITLLAESVITLFISRALSIRFIEIMFFAGVVFTALSVWFSGSGGTVTRFIDITTSARTGLLTKREEFHFRPNYVVLGSAIFLLIGLVLFILLLTNVIPPA
ncbi:hypothetical protein DFO73_106287 [Cytobacillus oceanisediminis]|uniref:DUF3899 domain-containing protein n=1 Tax=Cytobacillus oceanisediminis TaxID=665099 RepID=A0A2V2ZVK4_9BACI|nr:hypothetical protein [Cytobacillus oceanisediminis]PWW28471.1 hypothetical protein DFO73_106287 [Cytobacillus oceanisediminis]